MQKLNFKKLFRFEFGSVFLILVGAALLCNPDFGSAALASILGWILVGGGAVGLLIGFLSWPGLGIFELIGSIILLASGIYLLKNPLILATVVGILMGALLVSQGFGALRDSLMVKRFGGHYKLSLSLSIGMTALGFYLFLSPLTTSRIVMTIAGLIMVTCGISNLISHYKARKFINTSRKNIINNTQPPDIVDADE